MLRRSFAATSLACVLLGLSARAHAAGAWIPSGSFEPVEQRVAVAVGPARTTLWTSLRFKSSVGPVGVVVPAPPGSSLDFTSDAWFEALEVATAPRVFPPTGLSPYCPGDSGSDNIFETAGVTGHAASPKVDDITVLDDAAAVSAWASKAGLDLSPAVEAQLETLTGVRFVALRFTAPGGSAVTPTLRIAMPGEPPMLPLSLTRAASEDLHVTAFVIGNGRAQLASSTPVKVPTADLAWDAKAGKSNYEEARSAVLAAEGQVGSLLESASHDALVYNLPIASGTASINGLVTTFFERASAYGDASVDSQPCIAQSAALLGSASAVGASCPRADLGVVEGGGQCSEAPLPGEVDPAKLRCGGSADDLAVALSGLVPAQTWLTRQSLQIPAGQGGASFSLSLSGGGAVVTPVRTASGIDVSGCGNSSTTSGGMSSGSSMTSSSASGAGASGPTGSGVGVGVGVGAGAGAGAGGADGSGGSYESGGSYVPVDTSCTCTGSPEDTSSDSCDSSDTGGDSCDSGDGGDSCDSGDGGDSCDSGGGDSCDSGGGDLDCSGGGEDCSIGSKGTHKRRAPRLSPIALGLMALIAPLRRRGRRSRKLGAGGKARG